MAQSNAPAASDRLAPARDAGQATSRQRPLPDARMCGGEVSLQPLRFPRSHSSRGGEVSLSFEEDSEAVEARRRVGVRTAEHLIADRERPLHERKRSGKVALGLEQEGEVVEARRSMGMVRAERRFMYGQRPLVQPPRAGKVAPRLEK